VYLTGTVRDMQHRKMSKSLGNGIDPLEVVNQFGADALRYTLMQGMGLGVDVSLDPDDLEKSFAPGRNFATKLWNIGRFLLMQVGDEPVRSFADISETSLANADRWILGRLSAAISECDAALGSARPAGVWPESLRNAGLRLDAHAEAARRFVWNELADWYVEAAKSRLQAPGKDREMVRAILVHVFDQALRLLHPIMPFVTESLWRRLPTYKDGTFLARAEWPKLGIPVSGGERFEVAREAIGTVRQLRADYSIPAGQKIVGHVVTTALTAPGRAELLKLEAPLIGRMARCDLDFSPAPAGAAAHALLSHGLELVLPLAGVVALTKEIARLTAELGTLSKQLGALRGRLSNEKFTGKAPPELVDAERAKERDWTARCDQMQAKLKDLGAP
jgi:valyl-tRNA synthetase